jgi:hypothetical protein
LRLFHGLADILRPRGRPSLFNFAQTPRRPRAHRRHWGAGNGELPERCATLPHERSGMPFFSRTAPVALSPYRRLAFTTAAHWLLLGLQQEAVDGLLETEIASAAPGGAAPTFSNARHDSDRPTLGEQGARWTALNHSAFGADDGLRGLRRANSANHEEGV